MLPLHFGTYLASVSEYMLNVLSAVVLPCRVCAFPRYFREPWDVEREALRVDNVPMKDRHLDHGHCINRPFEIFHGEAGWVFSNGDCLGTRYGPHKFLDVSSMKPRYGFGRG